MIDPRLFSDPAAILHVAELGVVMFLFLIGLEMQPSRLWAMRRDIFGLGLVQVLTCGALLSGVGIAFGLPWAAAVIGAFLIEFIRYRSRTAGDVALALLFGHLLVGLALASWGLRRK